MEGGGQFICRKHDFSTTSIDDWNDHCDGNADHVESGSTVCISCGARIQFTDLPYQRIKPDGSKGIALKCEDCETSTVGSVKTTKIPTEPTG